MNKNEKSRFFYINFLLHFLDIISMVIILLKSFVKNDENIFLENVYEKYPNLQKLKNSTLKYEEAIDVMLDKIYFKDLLGEKLQKTLLLVNGFTDKHVDRIMGYFSHVNQTLLYGSKKIMKQ